MKTKIFLILLLAVLINVATSAADPGPLTHDQETIYWNAIKNYQEENYYESLLLFQNLLDANPENVELNYYAGMCYYNLNKPNLAKWHFSIASSDNSCRLKIIILAKENENENNLLSYNQ